MSAIENYNPDVLTCIANLSSDEVFTPPALANQVLDSLPESLWSDPTTTFLDPACKSGVFLREITKRLDRGLAEHMPDRRQRLNHIFKNQLYGIAITELTALLSRRSIYCSKAANSRYSVCDAFEKTDGNIIYTRVEHEWVKGRCRFCGASQEVYDRGPELETHAYPLLHTEKPEELFNMQFDVIISNPPYQMGSDGGTRDIPIYNKFVEQAKKLQPKYMTMIIPSRWMAGGLGLTEFRKTMLEDRHIRKLVDYERMDTVFPGVDFEGGVCYFLWDRENQGDCDVTTVTSDGKKRTSIRKLYDYDVFVRDSRALEILQKVLNLNEKCLSDLLSARTAFGFVSNYADYRTKKRKDDICYYATSPRGRIKGWVSRLDVTMNEVAIDTWKAMVPSAYGERGARPSMVLGPCFVGVNPSVCTQSFLFISTNTAEQASSAVSYYRTKFLRFLVSLRKITQHTTRDTYKWVPQQAWDREWTDEALYGKYGFTEAEIAYVESLIRPMEAREAE